MKKINDNIIKKHMLMDYYNDLKAASKKWDKTISINILDGDRNKLLNLSTIDIDMLEIMKVDNEGLILIDFPNNSLNSLNKEEAIEIEVIIDEDFEVVRTNGSKTLFKENKIKRFLISEIFETTIAGVAEDDPDFHCSYYGNEIPFKKI